MRSKSREEPVTYTLTNDDTSIVLNEKGSLISLVDLSTEVHWISDTRTVPAFEVWTGDRDAESPDNMITSDSFTMSVIGSSDSSLILLGEAEGIRVELNVSVAESGLSEWWIHVENRGESEIKDIVFPAVAGVTPPAKDCGITLPIGSGWWLPYADLGDDERIEWNYPIIGSMQWMGIGGPYEGFYVGCHDDMPLTKVITTGKIGGLGMASFRFTNVCIGPGESLELPPAVIGQHRGDWRASADIYREWCESWMDKPKIPERVLRQPHKCWICADDGKQAPFLPGHPDISRLAEESGFRSVPDDPSCGYWSPNSCLDIHADMKPSEGWAACIENLEDLRLKLKGVDPEFCMTADGVADVYGQYFDVLYGRSSTELQVGEKARPMPELFRYTLPWLVVCDGPVSEGRVDLLKLAHLIGSGCDFSGFSAERAKKVMEWRELFWDEIALGEFLGPCETGHPDFRACAFQCEERLVVTLAWMPRKSDPEPPETLTVLVPTKIHAKGIKLLTEEGESRADGKPSYGKLAVKIPFTDIGLLVIE